VAYLTHFAESLAAACPAIGLFTLIAAAIDGSSGVSGRRADTNTALLWLSALRCHLFQGRRPLFD
jgi:hypothetical protein